MGDSGRPIKRAFAVVLGGLVLLVVSASTISAQMKSPLSRRRVPGPPAEGKWSVTVSLNVSNDTPTVTAALAAEAPIRGGSQAAVPTLVVRCQTPRSQDQTVLLSTRGLPVQPGLDVYLVVGGSANVDHGDGLHTLGVRFDSDPAERWATVESTDTEALFIAPVYATQMVGKLSHSRRLLVELTPVNAPPATIAFDTRGFKTHAARVLAACPRVDRIRGRYPPGVEPLTGPTEPLIGRYTVTLRSGLGVLKAGHRPKRSAVRLRAGRSRHAGRRVANRA